MKNQITLNGKEFTHLGYTEDYRDSYRTLYQCYDKPSTSKIYTWEHWWKWFTETSDSPYDFIRVESYNVYMFTISGRVSVGENIYRIYITKTRQECREIR